MPDENLTPAPVPIPLVPLPHLLDISTIVGAPWSNPPCPYNTSLPDWSSNVVCGQTFDGSWSNPYEWVSVMNRCQEQDDEVGLAGIAVNPGMSDMDNPFFHPFVASAPPFGSDFEFTIIPDSVYTNLLAASNKDPDGRYKADWSMAQGAGIAVPTGLLGVEIDGALVPADFRVVQGDRVAVYGRWIVDAGHSDSHAEIHPPLLMALTRSIDNSGNITPRSENATTLFRLWSRPYQAKQLLTTNGDTLPLRDYLGRIANTLGDVQAYPSVFPQPFQLAHFVAFTVRPPVPAPADPTWQLQASYHFTVRDGCAVEVIHSPTEPNSLLVIVSLNSTGYPASPNPPNPHFVTYNVDDLLKVSPEGIGGFTKWWAENYIQVVYVQQYDPPPMSKTQDTINVQPPTPIATLRGGAGQATDNSQAFPVYGWVKLYWSPPAPDVAKK